MFGVLAALSWVHCIYLNDLFISSTCSINFSITGSVPPSITGPISCPVASLVSWHYENDFILSISTDETLNLAYKGNQ